MRVEIDGNDGTGKTTLVAALREAGVHVSDRGKMTLATDNPNLRPEESVIYILLDCPVRVSRARLEAAGKSLEEKYHTVQDLTFYRKRFLDVAELFRARIIDANQKPEAVLLEVMTILAPSKALLA